MERRKNRKLRGSVLLTVVFVMAILIVFLFGTLTLALASHNRAHVNYSSAQTGVTARTVAESAIRALSNTTEEGKAYKKTVGNIKVGNSIEVPVSLSGDNIGTMGDVDKVKIACVGTKKYYDTTKKSWEERDLLKFTSTVTLGGVKSSASVYVLKHNTDDDDGSGGGGAGFVTTADATLQCQTNLYGGSYISLPEKDDAKNYDYDNYSTLKRTLDKDNGTTEALIKPFSLNAKGWPTVQNVNNVSTPVDNNGEACALFAKNSGAIVEADLYVCNNMYCENWSGYYFPDKKKGITVWGDMFYLPNAQDQQHYYYGGPKDKNMPFNEMPYIYVNGKLFGALRMGDIDNPFPLNVFCGWIEADASKYDKSKQYLACNLYCMNEGANNIIKCNGLTKLNAWAGSVYTMTKDQSTQTQIAGDICAKGNLSVKDIQVGGDMRVEGNFDCEGTVMVAGDLVVGGTINSSGNLIVSGTVYNDSYSSFKYECYAQAPTEENGLYVNTEGKPLNNNYFDNGKLRDHLQGQVDLSAVTFYYPYKYDGATCTYELDEWSMPYISGVDGFKAYNDNGYNYFYAEGKEEEIDGSMVMVPANPIKLASAATGASNYGDSIYPKCAEKTVILGSDEKSKVVKTIYEVLDKVANPYEADELPPALKAKYEGYVNKDGTLTAEGQKILVTKGATDDETRSNLAKISKLYLATCDGNTGAYTTSADGAKGYYFDSDCIIDFGDKNNAMTDSKANAWNIVFNPKGNQMLVVVRNLHNASGAKILVDDSKGGAVYFYVDNDGQFYLEGSLATTSYAKLFSSGKVFKYASPNISDGKSLETELGKEKIKPNVYIYGGKGSEFNTKDVGYLTANIISPNLSGELNGGTGPSFDSFYYDNFDILSVTASKQYIFGCFNAKNVVSNNQFNVIYVTDDGPKSGLGVGYDDDYWCKVLYYSEF